jgi:hypothetical protein
MKLALTMAIAIFCVLGFAAAQSNDIGIEIKNLDKQEAEAVLKHDTTALERLWADNFTVNTPYNIIGTRKRGDRINLFYSRFDRTVEKVIVLNDSLVSTMGNEIVVRKAPMTLAGQTLTRRFTHLWIRKDQRWQLVVRHANFVCAEMPQQKLQ